MLEGVGGVLGDVVRFNPAGTAPGYAGSLLFYSNPVDGFDSLADTPSPPGQYYQNNLTIIELNGVGVYTPGPGQPGYVAGFNVTYNLISDGAIPEPTSMVLLGTGLVGFVMRRRSIKH